MSDEQNNGRIIELIQRVLAAAADGGPGHLSTDDWVALFSRGTDQERLESIHRHLAACRNCSMVLVEAEDYAETVPDAETLRALTPHYVPGMRPPRVILDTAGGRVWVEHVPAGWLLACMNLDVEVVAPSPEEGVRLLSSRIAEHAGRILRAAEPLPLPVRQQRAWLEQRGGTVWTEQFAAGLEQAVRDDRGEIERLASAPAHDSPVAETTTDGAGIGGSLPILTPAQLQQQTEDFRTALQLAQTMLNPVDELTVEIIRRKVAAVVAMLRSENGAVALDEEQLVRELEARYTIHIGSWAALDDDQGHLPWLPDRRGEIQWRFWRRYERFLREEKGWIPGSLNRLGEITDAVLERLEDPQRPGAWDRRGLVVGSVQSGKTANYIGLICKAADAGYRLIVVLAGMHSNLRSQTQRRIDEGFLGYNTELRMRYSQDNQRIGVGRLRGERLLAVHPLTRTGDQGDFKAAVADRVGAMLGSSEPIILVVKKHSSILENLLEWALAVQGVTDPATGRKVVRDVPLLLIDDEADNASINTMPVPVPGPGETAEDYNVTAINGKIRRLLESFEKKAYVGYTATPFANIFISPTATSERYGDDIFPRHFVINVPTPGNYVGPARVFGLTADPDAGIEEVQPLPIVRKVSDHEEAFPFKHRKEHVPPYLPGSLEAAIRAFILVCAARRARGQAADHNSMLVHVTRWIDVQARVDELIKDYLKGLQDRMAYGEGNAPEPVIAELERMWKDDFEPTSQSMPEYAGQPVTWEQVRAELHAAASRIQVQRVYGNSRDALSYAKHPSGLNVIAIGGDKLSRGLTLEGLSVSYYLRASRMYDTLMQMGRWFGYRPGYLDLCRLYTTAELIEWYRHITLADAELRKEFDYMAAIDATPEQYALRVRTHPEGLLITAMNKMQASTEMQVSYSGQIAELTRFHLDPERVERNLRTTETFLAGLPQPTRAGELGTCLWSGVPGDTVATFLSRMLTHPATEKANVTRLAAYIRGQMGRSELLDWTVALVSNTRKSVPATIAGYDVGLVWRKPADGITDHYAVGQDRILNPTDEYLDLTEEEVERALEITRARRRAQGRAEPKRPDDKVIREEMRPATRGLLLLYPLLPPDSLYPDGTKPIIGFAVSFPRSERVQPVRYRVNEIYWRQQLNEDDL